MYVNVRVYGMIIKYLVEILGCYVNKWYCYFVICFCILKNKFENILIKYILGIRLIGGDVNFGRVEIRFFGDWGIVCDDDFGIEEVRVVCWMFGKSMLENIIIIWMYIKIYIIN